MGFLKNILSSSGREQSRLVKNGKTVVNRYCQSSERYHAMQQLMDDGSTEAYEAVLKRFTVASSKIIEDEEEKGWVYKRVLELDKAVIPAVKSFCKKSDNLAWALRIVEEIANEQEEWEIIDAVLEAHPPVYERDATAKIQILTHIQEIDDARVTDILAAYSVDPDESVRYQVADGLIDIGDEKSVAPLVARLADKEEDSLRLRTRILDGLASLKWDLSEHKDVISASLGNDHSFDGKNIVRR